MIDTVKDTLGSFDSIRKTAVNRTEVLPWKIEEVSLVVYRCTGLFTLKNASFLVRFERCTVDKTIVEMIAEVSRNTRFR